MRQGERARRQGSGQAWRRRLRSGGPGRNKVGGSAGRLEQKLNKAKGEAISRTRRRGAGRRQKTRTARLTGSLARVYRKDNGMNAKERFRAAVAYGDLELYYFWRKFLKSRQYVYLQTATCCQEGTRG